MNCRVPVDRLVVSGKLPELEFKLGVVGVEADGTDVEKGRRV